MGLGDVGIQRGGINGCHNGVGRQRGEDIKKIISVPNIGGKGFD